MVFMRCCTLCLVNPFFNWLPLPFHIFHTEHLIPLLVTSSFKCFDILSIGMDHGKLFSINCIVLLHLLTLDQVIQYLTLGGLQLFCKAFHFYLHTVACTIMLKHFVIYVVHYSCLCSNICVCECECKCEHFRMGYFDSEF